MAEYRTTDADGNTVYVEKRGGAGRVIAIIAVIALVIVGLLFATGFWRMNASGGSLPKVDVSAKGGDEEGVDLGPRRRRVRGQNGQGQEIGYRAH